MLARLESQLAIRPHTAEGGEAERTKERLYTARTLHDLAPHLSNSGGVGLEIGGILRSLG